MTHTMHEMLKHYTPDEAAECLPYHPDPDNRIYRALYATLESDLWTVTIRACDGTHATAYATKHEAYKAAEKHLGQTIHSQYWEGKSTSPILRRYDDFGGVLTIDQFDGTKHMGDIWESLPEDIQEKLNAAAKKEYNR